MIKKKAPQDACRQKITQKQNDISDITPEQAPSSPVAASTAAPTTAMSLGAIIRQIAGGTP